VRSIQITIAEKMSVQDRGRFYDETGAIRDVLQNHMLQVLANLMMDPPMAEEHDPVRDEKARLLKAVRLPAPGHVVRGQYTGYHAVPGVNPDSTVDLRRSQAAHRYLALGRRTDLHSRWQGTASHCN
jgi:glucose-6-phosphate 1-dehydrogenase